MVAGLWHYQLGATWVPLGKTSSRLLNQLYEDRSNGFVTISPFGKHPVYVDMKNMWIWQGSQCFHISNRI